MALFYSCAWWAFRKVCRAVRGYVSSGCLRHRRSSLQTAKLQQCCDQAILMSVQCLGAPRQGMKDRLCFAAPLLLAETYCPILSLCHAVPRWLQNFGILIPGAP